jgi:hypothetical protein
MSTGRGVGPYEIKRFSDDASNTQGQFCVRGGQRLLAYWIDIHNGMIADECSVPTPDAELLASLRTERAQTGARARGCAWWTAPKSRARAASMAKMLSVAAISTIRCRRDPQWARAY